MNNKNRLIKVLVGGIIYATSFFVVFNSLALNISMFLVAYLIIGGDYLTTKGESPQYDRMMIERLGYRIAELCLHLV